MDEKRLRLIAAVVIVAIGVSYMTWLVLEYLKTQRLGEYVRNSDDRYFATVRAESDAHDSE